MAITTSAPNGVQVTSAAKNGTLGSQAGVASNEIEFDTDITTNNGNLEAGPVFPGRLVTVRAGASDEETRYITANTTTTRATVHEDWVSAPVSGDSYHVWYIIQDAATVTGLGLINKRVADYSSSRRFTVASGGYFCMVDGVSLETVDNGSTTVADVIIASGGRFQNGYLAGGVPVSGGYMIGTPATNGERVFDAQAGAICSLYDWFLTCVFQNYVLLNSDVEAKKIKLFSASYTLDLTGTVTTDLLDLEDITIEGKGAATDTITINQYTSINVATIISTNGFRAGTAGETNEVRNAVFTDNNLQFVTVANNSLAVWNFVNPLWNPNETLQVAGGGTFDFDDAGAGANGEINELFELTATVTQPDGTPIDAAEIRVYEGTQGNNLPYQGQSNTLGIYNVDVLTRNFIPAGNATHITTTTYGSHAVRANVYGRQPYASPVTFDAEQTISIALPVDSAITDANSANAIVTGSGITIQQQANSHYVLHYDGGTGSVPTVGETITVTNAGTNTTGVLVEYIGDATEGIIVLENWNGTVADNNAAVSGGTSSFAAVSDPTSGGGGSSFDGAYSWLVDCNSYALTITYDFLAAQMANTTLATTFADAHEWGQGEQTQLMYSGGSGYFTERNVTKTEGVWLANRGTGTVAFMTADDGSTYVPPVQYSFTLTGLKAGSEVRGYNTDPTVNPRESLFGTESSGTSFSYNYIYSTDIDIYVVIFDLTSKEVRLEGLTLSNANQTIPIQQQLDRVYSNP